MSQLCWLESYVGFYANNQQLLLNPFDKMMTIEYVLPYATDVTVKVYSFLGQNIATLANGRQPAGKQVITWDGKDMYGTTISSGLYFYEINLEDDGDKHVTHVGRMIKK